jgi:hypothetical protein
MINSLVAQGYIIQIGQSTYKINSGANVINRDPTATDDASQGYSPGSIWINSVSSAVWVNLVSTIGGAVWLNITTSGGGSGVTGTFS